MPYTSNRTIVRHLCVAGLAMSLSVWPHASVHAGELGSCPGVEIVEANLKDASSSGYFIPGLKLIIINRPRLQGDALPVQKFIFNHECAHADPAVGEDEDEADCAAAKRARNEGWLGKTEIIQICIHLGRMPVDATHKPVGARCANIRRCAKEADFSRQATNTSTLLPSDLLRR
jgi:hypothetical protein